MPLVRPPVTEERHDHCNARSAGAAAGVGESEQLEQVIVGRRRGRLDEEHLLAAHGLKKLHGNVTVGISIYHTGPKLSAQLTRDNSGQLPIGCTGEDRALIVHARLW